MGARDIDVRPALVPPAARRRPGAPGAGLGSVLLEHGLRRADATGHPCYLETFEERNVPFYLRHGFDLVVDEATSAPGLHIWGFYRPVASG